MSKITREMVEAGLEYLRNLPVAPQMIVHPRSPLLGNAAAAALEEDSAAAAQAEPTALERQESIVPDWHDDTEGALMGFYEDPTKAPPSYSTMGWYKPPQDLGSITPQRPDEVSFAAPADAHPTSRKFYAVLAEAARLHDKKQRDYGTDEDPFANVRASEAFGIPAWLGTMIRAHDKVRRLQTYALKGELANESVEDALIDGLVYFGIALVLFREREL